MITPLGRSSLSVRFGTKHVTYTLGSTPGKLSGFALHNPLSTISKKAAVSGWLKDVLCEDRSWEDMPGMTHNLCGDVIWLIPSKQSSLDFVLEKPQLPH